MSINKYRIIAYLIRGLLIAAAVFAIIAVIESVPVIGLAILTVSVLALVIGVTMKLWKASSELLRQAKLEDKNRKNRGNG